MTTLSFKAPDDLRTLLTALAGRKGVNVSAYIKLLLTEAIEGELHRVTENGITIAEELAVLESDATDDVVKFSNIQAVKRALIHGDSILKTVFKKTRTPQPKNQR